MEQSTDASYSADTAVVDPGHFECNICFELPHEPILTLCGHLYCWPCLYQWLNLHSHSLECPVCKAIVQEHQLIPIYGRGKTSHGPRSHPGQPGVTIPNRPMGGMRPPTAPPPLNLNYLRQAELDPMMGNGSRFGQMTLSTIFGAIPAIFNFQVHDATTVYGVNPDVPYLFSSSFHGGYVHGFHHHHSIRIDWRPIFLKLFFVLLAFFAFLHLILA
ncbi:hypothetical protein M569_13172 [Genlisea aurea]|uniref:E3 ubiquitin-protein ligase RMA n=1 Tax=Genlisea aurea TaxID=192259 RepID=S8DFN8_9LAMI|nr:hypothetical protein M569_13172 [Genlisea aurea]